MIGKWLVEQIVTEASDIKTVVAIYPGRFQPFGPHHAKAFHWLEKKFGANNTFIATSDKTELPKSPLNFKDKQSIISQYGIDNVIQVKNPYKAEEILRKYDPDTTAVVFMVGEKDMQEDPRFAMKQLKSGNPSYFKKYNANEPLQGYMDHGYLIVAPHVSLNVPGIGEMSGTALRQALKTSTPETFKNIMGWYSPTVYKTIVNRFNENKKPADDPCWKGYRQYGMKKKSGKQVPNCVREHINIMTEGGAGGHMSHPFDIPSVQTGKDLMKVFLQSVKFLEKGPASVKIDGVNASIRLITLDGKKQFVMDRGSNKPLDVKGITKTELGDRFGAGHGMIKIGGTVLDIFNQSIPDTQSELKKLGLWDNPNILFNIEYVAGSTNVLSYNKNFLAIHGLLEIQQVTPKRRATKETTYNKKALQDLLNKLAPTASEYGYEVLGSVPTTLDQQPDFNGALNKKYTVSVNGEKQTKSLSGWLNAARNPIGINIKTKDGKTIAALSKQVLVQLSQGTDVADFIAAAKDYQTAIDGYVFYLATMELGQAVLDALNSPLGPVKEHEGIVIRDNKIYSKPFKITGRFIVQGLESQFK
jgi:hypothetical protein